jgi:hypothetical protein
MPAIAPKSEEPSKETVVGATLPRSEKPMDETSGHASLSRSSSLDSVDGLSSKRSEDAAWSQSNEDKIFKRTSREEGAKTSPPRQDEQQRGELVGTPPRDGHTNAGVSPASSKKQVATARTAVASPKQSPSNGVPLPGAGGSASALLPPVPVATGAGPVAQGAVRSQQVAKVPGIDAAPSYDSSTRPPPPHTRSQSIGSSSVRSAAADFDPHRPRTQTSESIMSQQSHGTPVYVMEQQTMAIPMVNIATADMNNQVQYSTEPMVQFQHQVPPSYANPYDQRSNMPQQYQGVQQMFFVPQHQLAGMEFEQPQVMTIQQPVLQFQGPSPQYVEPSGANWGNVMHHAQVQQQQQQPKFHTNDPAPPLRMRTPSLNDFDPLQPQTAEIPRQGSFGNGQAVNARPPSGQNDSGFGPPQVRGQPASADPFAKFVPNQGQQPQQQHHPG